VRVFNFMFKERNGQPWPILPHDQGGAERVADGVTAFNLAQAQTRFNLSAEALIEEWRAVWGDLVPTETTENRPDDLFPTAGGAAQASTPAMVLAKQDIIHAVRFPHLDADQWEYVKDDCRRRSLDPRLVWVKIEFNEETQKREPQIITTIAALRGLAEETGRLLDESLPDYCDEDGVWTPSPWLGTKPPVAARVSIEVAGRSNRVYGIATWKRCAQYFEKKGTWELLRHWKLEHGGAEQLGKCGAADAFRRGFTEKCGKIYTLDEMPVVGRRTRTAEEIEIGAAPVFNGGTGEVIETEMKPPTVTAPVLIDDPKAHWQLVDDTTPDGVNGLILALMSLDVGSRAQCETLIALFKEKLPRLAKTQFQIFAAVVLKEIRERPAAYGVAA